MVELTDLRSLHARGRAAHPAIDLAFERFAAAAQARDMEPDAIAADLYLAVACELGDPVALAELERGQLAELVTLLRRVEKDRSVVDEIVQRVRVRSLVASDGPARIATYSGRGSLIGWLKVMALRLLSNHRRDERRRPDAPRPMDEPAVDAPELVIPGLLPEVSAALRVALRALPPRERNLMRLSYAKGISLERIGQLYGVHKGTISRWLAAARDQILTAALEQVRRSIDVDRESLTRACAQLESRLELSLSVLYSTVPTFDGARSIADG